MVVTVVTYFLSGMNDQQVKGGKSQESWYVAMLPYPYSGALGGPQIVMMIWYDMLIRPCGSRGCSKPGVTLLDPWHQAAWHRKFFSRITAWGLKDGMGARDICVGFNIANIHKQQSYQTYMVAHGHIRKPYHGHHFSTSNQQVPYVWCN